MWEFRFLPCSFPALQPPPSSRWIMLLKLTPLLVQIFQAIPTAAGTRRLLRMVQLSPDNGLPGWDRISGYFYPDSTIAGFSHTHLSGTGAGDLYDISFMPVTLPYKEAPAPLGIHSLFSHADEEASAGYYKVLLKDYGIRVELTATERCGIQRYTFPRGSGCCFPESAQGYELGCHLGFAHRAGGFPLPCVVTASLTAGHVIRKSISALAFHDRSIKCRSIRPRWCKTANG